MASPPTGTSPGVFYFRACSNNSLKNFQVIDSVIWGITQDSGGSSCPLGNVAKFPCYDGFSNSVSIFGAIPGSTPAFTSAQLTYAPSVTADPTTGIPTGLTQILGRAPLFDRSLTGKPLSASSLVGAEQP